jgi:hypothetical protein
MYNIKSVHAQQAKTIQLQEHKGGKNHERLTQLVDSITYAELINTPLYKHQNKCK